MNKKKIESSLVVIAEGTFTPLVILKMEFRPPRELIQGLHSNTNGEVDDLFDMFETELKKLREEIKQKKQ